MEELDYKDVDKCKYGFRIRIRTRIWNDISNWEPRSLCRKDCEAMHGNKHAATAQRELDRRQDGGREGRCFKQIELYRIPSELVEEILLSIDKAPHAVSTFWGAH